MSYGNKYNKLDIAMQITKNESVVMGQRKLEFKDTEKFWVEYFWYYLSFFTIVLNLFLILIIVTSRQLRLQVECHVNKLYGPIFNSKCFRE